MDRFCLGDNTITFSDDFAKLNELRKGISCISRYAKIGTYIAQRVQETGQKPNVDRIAQGFTSQMNEAIEGGTIPVAIDFLVNNGIYDCSEELFIRKYKDQYFDIENSTGYKKFIQKYNAVTDAYVMENAQKHLKRASRSRWEGGGFGIRGAIKGAVDASILNAATDTFRGIGDGISDFAGSVHYKNQKELLLFLWGEPVLRLRMILAVHKRYLLLSANPALPSVRLESDAYIYNRYSGQDL